MKNEAYVISIYNNNPIIRLYHFIGSQYDMMKDFSNMNELKIYLNLIGLKFDDFALEEDRGVHEYKHLKTYVYKVENNE